MRRRGWQGDEPAPSAVLAYVLAVAGLAAALAAWSLSRVDASPWEWATFALIAACAAGVQYLSRGKEPGSPTFLVAGALLLSPALAALVGAAQHSFELIRERGSVRIRVLVVSRSALAGLLASLSAHRVAGTTSVTAAETRWALAGVVAVVVVFAVDRLVTAGFLAVSGGRQAVRGLLRPFDLAAELVLAMLGVAVATVWSFDPWLIPFAVAPLLVVHRSLDLPALREQARLDPKTGLYNARHFDDVLRGELARSKRIGARLSVAMADLDFLRNVNNTHGHLAGDAVLAGVADIFRAELRPYDVAARFGGEEFAILLPETTREEALDVAERLRSVVSTSDFLIGAERDPVRVTVSIGVASFPEDATRARELVHSADVAAYRAKVQGRNRVVLAGDGLELEAPPPLPVREGPLAAPRLEPASPQGRLRRLRLPSQDDAGAWILAALSFAGVGALVVGAMAGAPRLALALGGVAVLCVLLARRRQTAAAALTHRRAEELWRAADALQSRAVTAERAMRRLRERSAEALTTLSAAVDARDAFTAGHSERVRRAALAIGAELGMSAPELEVLGHAALLCDLGKLTIPEAILLKPARLDAAEWGIVRRHPTEGANLIGALGFLEDALPAIKHHHERFDGSGYPDHLRGEEIPLGARIIHVADALDAMLTPRVYRPARTAVEALDELRDGAGTQFCPRCVAALERVMLAELTEGAHVPYALLEEGASTQPVT